MHAHAPSHHVVSAHGSCQVPQQFVVEPLPPAPGPHTLNGTNLRKLSITQRTPLEVGNAHIQKQQQQQSQTAFHPTEHSAQR